jgi:hypothetical protein
MPRPKRVLLGRPRVAFEAARPSARAGVGACVRLGEQLDAVGAERGRPLDRRGLGVDEEAHPHARAAEACDGGLELTARRVDGPSRLARDLARQDWDEGHLVRTDLVDELDQVGPRIPFDVVLDAAAERGEERGDLADRRAG